MSHKCLNGSGRLIPGEFLNVLIDPEEDDEDPEEEFLHIPNIDVVTREPSLSVLDVKVEMETEAEFKVEWESEPEPEPEPDSDCQEEDSDCDSSSTPRPSSPVHDLGVSTQNRAGCESGVVESRRGRSARGTDRHGQPFVERYATDEELPQQMLEQIGRLAADRDRRVRERRERRDVLGEALVDKEEVFFDACEGFQWEPVNEWRGEKETFIPERTGPTRVFTNAYAGFRAYWDDGILSHIVSETNRYAQTIQSERFRQHWYDTNLDEILVLFAFWMMLGIIRMPSIKSCFSKIPMMRTDIFRQLFSETRYWNLNRAFHLANGSSDPNDPENALFPMGPVIDHLNNKFKEHYIMDQDICIYESLALRTGPMKLIRMKAARLGSKTYQLCESKTGYCWSFFVYLGRRSTVVSTLASSESFVMKLVRPILNLGHVLYMDNWFNSPQLARYLKRRGTDCVGTLRPSRKDVPLVVQKADLAEGQFVARQSRDVAVFALHDKKRVHLICTYHNTAQVEKAARSGRPAQYKLALVDDYNRGMRGVDRMDQMLEPYLVESKQCKKWTNKLFKYFLNVSIQNVHILVEQSTGAKGGSLGFRMALVQSIVDEHLNNVPRRPVRTAPPNQKADKRLTERHFAERIPVPGDAPRTSESKSSVGRAYCVWCRKCGRNSKTVYHCPDCEVALCFDRGCFKLYHTVAEPGQLSRG